MIENYIGKPIKCDCGKEHRSRMDVIEIKKGVIENELVAFLKENGYKRLTVVCDKNTYRVAGERVCKVLEQNGISYKLHTYLEDEVLPNEHFIGNLAVGMDIGCDLMLAVGSGTINDICRYVSAVAGKEYVIVGTAPSMDGYNSGVSALIYNNTKRTIETHTPKAVFLDPDILVEAPKDMIGAGVGDLLGKINCLTDWKLAKIVNDEWHCEFISNIVDTAITKITDNKEGLANGESDAIADLVEGLLLSGVCMDFAGNTRPASGAEHHMSHFWEMRYLIEGRKAVFHGTKVGIGTIIALKAYEYLSNLNVDFDAIKKLNRPTFEEWAKDIEKVYLTATEEVLALEKKCQKNSEKSIKERLIVVEKNWDKIQNLAKNATKSSVAYDILSSLDAPTKPAHIGVDKTLARQAIVYAKELRDRYTILQLLYDIGELENFADMVISEYYN